MVVLLNCFILPIVLVEIHMTNQRGAHGDQHPHLRQPTYKDENYVNWAVGIFVSQILAALPL